MTFYRKTPFISAWKEELIIAIAKIINSVIPAIQVTAMAELINCCSELLIGQESIQSVVSAASVYIILLGMTWIDAKLISIFSIRLKNKFFLCSQSVLMNHCEHIPYNKIEEPDAFEQINRLMKNGEKKWADTYLAVIDSIALIIKIIALFIVILKAAAISACILVLSIIPMIISGVRGGERIYSADLKAQKAEHKSEYAYSVLVDKKTCQERNVFGYYSYVRDLWNRDYCESVNLRIQAEKEYSAQYIKNGVLIHIATMLCILALIPSLSSQKIDTGLFISLTGTLLTLLRSLNSGINRCCRELGKGKLFLTDYFDFLKICDYRDYFEESLPNIVFKRIEFKNLSFRYPNQNAYALENINIVFENKKHYAIVGANGSGKTTLIKILCGLYKDYDGTVVVDENKGLDSIACDIGSVFQDFAKLQFSVADNILMGQPMERKHFEKCLELSELSEYIMSLPDKENTMLGKIYESGIDLSGGLWQRLAIARVLYQNRSIMILDEPTASLDPSMESRIYEQFDSIAKDKMVIFISHRLSAAKLMDSIIVMENGTVVEQGSFEELIKMDNGRFRNMYVQQKGWYDYENVQK